VSELPSLPQTDKKTGSSAMWEEIDLWINQFRQNRTMKVLKNKKKQWKEGKRISSRRKRKGKKKKKREESKR
jgi:hypothetical protein